MNKTPFTPNINGRQPHHLLAHVGIGSAICCWGSAYVAARYLLHPPDAGIVSLSPLLLATLRFSIASCFFLVPLIQAIVRRQVSGRDLLMMALLGQLTFSIYYWLQYIGIQETNASISSILGVGLIPIFTAFLSQAFGEERLHLFLFVALLIGFGGVALIVLQQPLAFSLQSGFLLGALCLVSNTFFFALYTILSKRWMRTISAVVMTGGTMVSGTLGLLFLSLLDPTGNHWYTVAMLNGVQWIALLFLALACSVLAYFAYNVALRTMKASRVTIYFYFEPLVTIVLGVLLLGEHLTWQILVGATAIGGALVIVNQMRKVEDDTQVIT